MQVLGDEVIGSYEKILLYGMPGTGKTFAAGTMPGNIYILCIGGSNELKVLRSPQFREKHPHKEGKIAYDFIKEERGARGAFKSATAFDFACDLLDEALELDRKGEVPGIGGFDSIAIDNATLLSTVQMNKAIELNYASAKSKSKTTLKQLRDENIIIPGDNDYMSQMSLMTMFVEWLFTLDKHVLLVAHEWRETQFDRGSRQTTVSKYRPLFTGKHREDIPLLFDNVWRMTCSGGGRGIQYETQTVADDLVLAKTRFGGVLRPKIRDLNISDAIEAMQSYAKEVAIEEA